MDRIGHVIDLYQLLCICKVTYLTHSLPREANEDFQNRGGGNFLGGGRGRGIEAFSGGGHICY